MKRTSITRKPFRRKTTPQMVGSTDFRAKFPHWPVGYQPEKDFQSSIEALAGHMGWMASHSHLPFFDTAGWPDLALVHPTKHRFLVRELKVTTKTGRVPSPNPLQWRWLTALSEAGVDADVWTWPQDWDRAIRELS